LSDINPAKSKEPAAFRADPQPAEMQKPHRGIAVLVLSFFALLGAVVGFLFSTVLILVGLPGLAACIIALADLYEMNIGRMDATGRTLTKAGLFIGALGLSLMLIALIIRVLS